MGLPDGGGASRELIDFCSSSSKELIQACLPTEYSMHSWRHVGHVMFLRVLSSHLAV